jgi:hypothetical protein
MSEDSLDMWLRDTPLAADAAIFYSTICFGASSTTTCDLAVEMGVYVEALRTD